MEAFRHRLACLQCRGVKAMKKQYVSGTLFSGSLKTYDGTAARMQDSGPKYVKCAKAVNRDWGC